MSRRYKIHDPQGMYFLTPTIVGWVDLLSRACYREIILRSLSFCRQNQGLRLHAYVIMTNHLHLIASPAPGYDLVKTLQNFKKFTAREFLQAIDEEAESRQAWLKQLFRQYGNQRGQAHQLWSHHNRPIELYSAHVIRQKLEYLHMNPVKAGWVIDPTAWLHSSALDYAGGKGPLELDLLDV